MSALGNFEAQLLALERKVRGADWRLTKIEAAQYAAAQQLGQTWELPTGCRAWLYVTVRDRAGNLVSGATVEVYSGSILLQTGQTDNSGSTNFIFGESLSGLSLVITASGYQTATDANISVSCGSTTTALVTIRLATCPMSVTGRVVDVDSGAGVGGVAVSIVDARFGDVYATLTTANDGSFSGNLAAPNNTLVQVNVSGYGAVSVTQTFVCGANAVGTIISGGTITACPGVSFGRSATVHDPLYGDFTLTATTGFARLQANRTVDYPGFNGCAAVNGLQVSYGLAADQFDTNFRFGARCSSLDLFNFDCPGNEFVGTFNDTFFQLVSFDCSRKKFVFVNSNPFGASSSLYGPDGSQTLTITFP